MYEEIKGVATSIENKLQEKMWDGNHNLWEVKLEKHGFR